MDPSIFSRYSQRRHPTVLPVPWHRTTRSSCSHNIPRNVPLPGPPDIPPGNPHPGNVSSAFPFQSGRYMGVLRQPIPLFCLSADLCFCETPLEKKYHTPPSYPHKAESAPLLLHRLRNL